MNIVLDFLKYLAKFCLGLIGIALTIFILFGFAIAFIDVNQHKTVIQEKFTEYTGQTLKLNGPVAIRFFPLPKISFTDASLVYKQDKISYSVSAQKFSFFLIPASLFSDRVRVKNIDAQNIILIFKDGDKEDKMLIDSYRGQMVTSNTHAEISDFHLLFKDYDLSGDMLLYFLNKEVEVKGDFTAKRWLTQLSNDKKDPNTNKLFSLSPFILQGIKPVVGEIHLVADSLQVEDFVINNAQLNMQLKRDSTQVDIKGKLNSGDLQASIELGTGNQGAIKTDITLKGAKADEFLQSFHPHAQVSGGTLALDFSGQGKGSDLASFKKNVSGKLFLRIKDLILENKQIDSSLLDIFSAFWKIFGVSKNQTRLECVAARFRIQSGVMHANESIGIDTPDLYALGTGRIGLSNNDIHIAFDIFRRSQLNLDVGANSTMVTLKGPLSHPSVNVSPKGVASDAGSILLGIATGGISLLAEKVVKIVTQRGSPCQEVLNNP